MIGVITDQNANTYTYRVGAVYFNTGITRTTGWHRFAFDYRDGVNCVGYIDGTQIFNVADPDTFTRITGGNWWAASDAIGYWDDVNNEFENLAAEFDVRHSATEDLAAEFDVRRSATEDLAAEFFVVQWLPGWGKRVKFSADSGDITAALSNFPVLAYLGSSAGINNDDIRFVFAEVGANSLKIAVTTDDGETECKVEIEKWDNGAKEAWLWIKAPSISSSVDQDFYLYFDNSHADNNANVGVVGSVPGEAVWDSDFLMVQHQAAAASPIPDSTSNDNDMTEGGDPAYQQPGPINGQIVYDGNDYHISAVDIFDAIVGAGKGTVEIWIKTTASDAASRVYFTIEGAYALVQIAGEGGVVDAYWSGTHNDAAITISQINTGAQFYLATSYDGANQHVYVDGDLEDTDACNLYDITGISRASTIASQWDGTLAVAGSIDEVRVSKTNRSTAWIAASYESGQDDLLDWGGEEGRVSVDLYCQFSVGGVQSGSEDLLGVFVVRQEASTDLAAEFTVQQEASEDLLGEFYVGHSGSVDLPGEFVVRNADIGDLFGVFDVRQEASTDLAAEFIVTRPGTTELLGEFIVQQESSAELLAEFDVRQEVSVDLLGEFSVRHVGTPVELLGEFVIRRTSTEDLLGIFDVRQETSVELLVEFIIRQEVSVDLLGEFVIRRAAIRDLPAQFEVGQGAEDLPGEFVIRKTATLSLAGSFTVKHTATVELAAELIVQQAAISDLRAFFWVNYYSVDLLAGFNVRQSSSRATDFTIIDNTRGLTVEDADREMTVTPRRRMRVK